MKKILTIAVVQMMLLSGMMAQTMVYLEHCETLSFDQKRLPDAQLLKGDVRFRHEDALMYCDSAYFYDQTNSLDAFGHVRFVQGDTLEGTGEMLHYNGNTRMAHLKNNVVLTHITTVLTTDILFYNRNANTAYYSTGGTIRDGQDTLNSQWGAYHVNDKVATFHQDVHLKNEQFDLTTDSLIYKTAQHIAILVKPTTIVYDDETTILSHDGWYNTSTELSMLLSRSQIIHIDGKQLTGDTIFYDRKQGIGKVLGHMEMMDTVQRVTLLGNYGIMREKEKSGFATDSAYVLDWSQANKSYIHADTIFTEPIDSTFRRVRAYHHVRGYNDDYQFVCDSMVYNGKDSIITLHHEPVLWSQNNQVSADTMYIYLNDSTVDYLQGIGSAFGIKQEGEAEFDQLSGKEMKAFIRKGELREIQVSGNAETVFYPRNEDDSTYVGVNKSQSSYVTIYLENNHVHHVLFTTATTGTMYPLDQIEEKDTKLIGFFWAMQERPTSPRSIFLRPERTERPTQKAISATEDEEEEETTTTTKTKTKRNRKER